MILLVHSLYFVLKFALKLYRKRRAGRDLEEGPRTREEDLERFFEDSLLFDPPVYRQRYAAVQDVLLDPRWRRGIRKVADFGCAEMGFFVYMKHLFGVGEILMVDFDLDLLENYKYRIQPLNADFLSGRSEPLLVQLLCGSIADPDCRLCDVDAVVGIEIIEHLFPDTLEALTYNIFGYINPLVAVFTTPNADFNILFKNFKKFRHYDHKFEWSREQFQEWAHNICARFPEYSVHFQGIGKGPKGTESLGLCSQMAVFVREYVAVSKEVPDETECRVLYHRKPDESYGICTYYSYTNQMKSLRDLTGLNACDIITNNSYYKLVDSVEYPHRVDNRTTEEKLLQEAMCIVYRNATYHSRFYNEDTGLVEIPLYEIVHNFDGHYVTEKEIRSLLVEAEFTVRECALVGSNETCPCVVYDIDMDKHSSPATSVGDKSEQEYNVNLNNDTESDWDCEYEHVGQADQRKEEEAAELSPVSGAEPSEQLFDSGYQKSISNAEWSPTTPVDGTFEDHFNSFMKLDINDIKENMKERRNMIAGTSCRKSPVNECQPGTSTGENKKKKRKGKKAPTDDQQQQQQQQQEEENVDLRMLADCIVYNTLNMLHVEAEAVPPDPPPARIMEAAAAPGQEAEAARYPPAAVENGDLANNNRDDEGNNYPDDAPALEVAFIVDDANNANENRDVDDNAGELADAPVLPLVDQDQQNRNDIPNRLEVFAEPEAAVDYEEDEADAAFTVDDPALNHASREALFDPDSQLDMLDDFPETRRDVEPASIPVIIRMDHIAEEHIDVGLPNEANPFPNWLLQLLGQQVEEEGDGNHDEPHFYCQGDGLGVHPSIIEVDVDDSTSESSSNDEAQAEQTLSEEDVGSLPTDANSDTQTMQLVGQPIALRASGSAASNDSNEEFFDTVDEEVGNFPGTNIKK